MVGTQWISIRYIYYGISIPYTFHGISIHYTYNGICYERSVTDRNPVGSHVVTEAAFYFEVHLASTVYIEKWL